MMIRKSTLAVVLMGVLALAGCRTAQIENINDVSYGLSATTSPKPLALEDFEKAIVRAGTRRNWVFERVETGHLIGTNDVRGKHTAVVDVKFDTETFSITFNRAQNLNHDAAKGQIHPNYNHWVRNLRKDIQSEVQLARAS